MTKISSALDGPALQQEEEEEELLDWYRNGQSLYIMLDVIRLVMVKNNFWVPKNKWTKSKADEKMKKLKS